MIKERHLKERAFATFREQPTTELFICCRHTLTHRRKNFYYRLPLSSGRDGQIPGEKRTLLSISLLPREVWMTKSSVSVRPSHSLIRRRASSPAELTFLGERWRERSTGQWWGRFNHTCADSLRAYNPLYTVPLWQTKCKCFTFHESLKQISPNLPPLTCINIWIY